MPKILITGGTGFVGTNLALSLNKEYDVTCIGRKNSNFKLLKSSGVKVREVDVLRSDQIKKIRNEFFAIFHLANIVSVSKSIENPEKVFINNVMSTLNLLEFAKSNKSIFIYPSSDRVYGNPKQKKVNENAELNSLEFYSTSKVCSELLIKNYSRLYGINYMIFRIGNIFGPRQSSELFIPSVINQMIKKNKINVGNLENFRNFVYIKDLIKVYSLALKSKHLNETMNISSYNVKIEEILFMLKRLAKKYLNKDVKIVIDKKLVKPAKSELKRFELDCGKARKLLSWRPEYIFEDALKETFEFYLK